MSINGIQPRLVPQASPLTGGTALPLPQPQAANDDSFSPAVYTDLDRARRLGLPEDTTFVHELPPVPGTFPPAPKALPRPVLLVHGLGQGGSYWFNLRNYLTSNPANRPGPNFQAKKEFEFVEEVRKDPGARVFSITLSDPTGSYRDLAPELTRCLEILRRETGSAEIDIVAHSMGGLVTREHLDGPEDGVNKFIMLATPNHGSLQADLALAADRLRLYRHYGEGAIKVLQDISIDDRFLGRENNPYLNGLNERWPQQKAKVDPVIITGAGIPTPDWNLGLFSTGDGLVTARSAWMPETEYYVAEVPKRGEDDRLFSFKFNHGQIQDQPGVAHLVGEILTR